jgi:hypothetical protein
MSAKNSLPQQDPKNQDLLTEEMARATYRPSATHSEFTASSRYDFNIQLCFDPQDNPAYQLTITRKTDNVVLHQCFYYSTEDVDDAASAWKVQLGMGSISTEMWGHS